MVLFEEVRKGNQSSHRVVKRRIGEAAISDQTRLSGTGVRSGRIGDLFSRQRLASRHTAIGDFCGNRHQAGQPKTDLVRERRFDRYGRRFLKFRITG